MLNWIKNPISIFFIGMVGGILVLNPGSFVVVALLLALIIAFMIFIKGP